MVSIHERGLQQTLKPITILSRKIESSFPRDLSVRWFTQGEKTVPGLHIEVIGKIYEHGQKAENVIEIKPQINSMQADLHELRHELTRLGANDVIAQRMAKSFEIGAQISVFGFHTSGITYIAVVERVKEQSEQFLPSRLLLARITRV